MILVVGNLPSWARAGRALPRLDGFRFVAFADLDAALLAEAAPELVLSPLVDAAFDAVDVARRLGGLGFRGRYLALADRLPNPDAVRAEVRAAAPALDFDLLVVTEGE